MGLSAWLTTVLQCCHLLGKSPCDEHLLRTFFHGTEPRIFPAGLAQFIAEREVLLLWER